MVYYIQISFMEINMDINNTQNKNGIPMPIVTLNRAILTFGILFALLTQQTWLTTILFLILLPTTLLGKQYSIIYWIGSWLFRKNCDYPAWFCPDFLPLWTINCWLGFCKYGHAGFWSRSAWILCWLFPILPI